jgi:acyl-CoA thioester hydrolase
VSMQRSSISAQQGKPGFCWPVRVYYEDTDSGGVVYHANYLNFMERARTEWLRSLGYEQTYLKEELGVLFVVRDLSIHYQRPAKFNDQLNVECRLNKIGRSSLQFEQVIKRGQEVISSAIVGVVCIDAALFKPVSIPAQMKAIMEKL